MSPLPYYRGVTPNPPEAARHRKLALLFLLYFAQGLPTGFGQDLSLLLRKAGVSLAMLGAMRLAAWPWMLKALWAPLVDRYGSRRFGRRKSWIVPMQILLSLTCFTAGFFPPSSGLSVVLGFVVVMNLLAATQDIAVDGLAVDLLQGRDLGPANTAQVVGYKTGMLVGGGVLMQFYPVIGWRGLLWIIAGLFLLVMAVVLPMKEVPPPPDPEDPGPRALDPAARTSLGSPPPRAIDQTRSSLAALLDALYKTLAEPQALWLLVFVATYKLGESLVDPMFKPFLIDAGYTPPQIARWVTSYGMIASLLGSALGGFLAFRLPLLFAVALASVFRALSVAGEWYLTLAGKPPIPAVLTVTIAEHFCGGMLTTTMFALMMSRVNKAIGATHYTLLASVELLGKMPASLISGVLAERLGYRGLFGIGTLLSFAFLVLLVPLGLGARRPPPPAPDTPHP